MGVWVAKFVCNVCGFVNENVTNLDWVKKYNTKCGKCKSPLKDQIKEE